MKIKTRLTVSLFISYTIIISVFVIVVGNVFKENQYLNLSTFQDELIKQNTKLLEDASRLFFKLVDEKVLDGLSREELFEYIKSIDQLHREAVIFDYEGHSLLKGHSRPQLEILLSPAIIKERLLDLKNRNIKNFSRDNYERFKSRFHSVIPIKIYYQIYNGHKLIIGFGQTLEDIKTGLMYISRENQKNQHVLLVVTFVGIIIGITFITGWVFFFSSTRIFTPLERLLERLGHVARGEFCHRVDVSSTDEIGKLASAFNHMSENLCQSVNEIHEANAKLDTYSKDLENQVMARTKELSDVVVQLKQEIEERKLVEKALENARLESESANIAKSQFLANMSHEIRTPMNAILGMSELVLGTALSPVQHDYIVTLKTSSESLMSLLNDILDLSKMEVGKLDVELIEFQFYDWLQHLSRNLIQHAQRKGLSFEVEMDMEIPPVVIGDPVRLRQIMNNLIGNAIKFTPSGRILVSVKREFHESLATVIPSGIVLKFTISDTGIGIPEEQQRKIFDKFYQTDSSVTRRFGGTGLGLAISLQLAHLLGGQITVQSPGLLQDPSSGLPGSSFSFSLVFDVPKDFQNRISPSATNVLSEIPVVGLPSEPEPAAPVVEPAVESTNTPRVLVAEDNLINQKLIRHILEKIGYRSRCVLNGKEAVNEIKNSHYDLILMDIQMPEMDGVEATSNIRLWEKESGKVEVPIIAVTAHAMKGDKEHFMEVGMNAYLAKPIKQAELIAIIKKFIPSALA